MDDLIKLSILDEVDTQCILALSSYEKMNDLITNLETRQSKEIWKYLQAFLAHTGILASLIFKQGNPEKTRNVTDYLKSELSISEDSPIKQRGGRNFLEHIEVFEIYASNRKDTKGILQMVFNNRNGLNYFELDNWYIKRGLIMDEMIFIYQNQGKTEELQLKPIFEELNRLYDETEKARMKLPIHIY